MNTEQKYEQHVSNHSPVCVCVCLSACNVTIHNRCRDSLASCAKMKQRVRPVLLSLLITCLSVCINYLSHCLSASLQQQQKLTLVRNSSALQNVALRTKSKPTCLSVPLPVCLSTCLWFHHAQVAFKNKLCRSSSMLWNGGCQLALQGVIATNCKGVWVDSTHA